MKEKKSMSRTKILNVEIDNLSMEETINKIDELIQTKIGAYVVTPNVDHIVRLEKDDELKQVYNHADLILCDGKPVIWASRLLKTPIKEKISGSDLFPFLCELAVEKKYKMFFLGAKEGVAKKAKENIEKKYKGICVAGTYSPSFGFENNEEEIDKIIEMVKIVKPDILIVGLGCPKQEKFIYKYKDLLCVPISLGLGATIDFEAGQIKRAPKWMSNHGLEWFYRMLKDPRRLLRRYLVDDIKIVTIFVKYKKIGKKKV